LSFKDDALRSPAGQLLGIFILRPFFSRSRRSPGKCTPSASPFTTVQAAPLWRKQQPMPYRGTKSHLSRFCAFYTEQSPGFSVLQLNA
jgi:hypothetical protein